MQSRYTLNKAELALKYSINKIEKKAKWQYYVALGEIPYESDEVKVVTARYRFQELYQYGREISNVLRNTNMYYSKLYKRGLTNLHYPQFESQAQILKDAAEKSYRSMDVSQRALLNLVPYMSRRDRQELGSYQRSTSPIHMVEKRRQTVGREVSLMDVMRWRLTELYGDQQAK